MNRNSVADSVAEHYFQGGKRASLDEKIMKENVRKVSSLMKFLQKSQKIFVEKRPKGIQL